MKNTAYTTRDWFKGRLAAARGPKGEEETNTAAAWIAADMVRTTIGDYAKFVVSVMHNDGLTPQVATERLTMTRNLVTSDQKPKLCPLLTPGAADCELTAGMGLGWQVIGMNGETIVDHTGHDTGVHTLAFFLPARQMGAVIFTNGENGAKVIGKVVEAIYPNQAFVATVN